MSPSVVLVVESTLELQRILILALEMHGHRVHAVETASEAMEFLRVNRVDLLVSDIPPGPAGVQVVRTLQEQFPDLPVVMMSASGFLDPRVYLGDQPSPGWRRTIEKPFRLSDLAAACDAAVRARGAIPAGG